MGAASEESYRSALDRLKGGEFLGTILGTPGYPTRWEWRRRKKSDPAFASEVEMVLRSTVRPGFGIPIPPETWQRVIEAAEKQPTLKAVAKLDGMPTYDAILMKMKRDPDFDAAIRSRIQMGEKIRRNEQDILAAVEALKAGASYTAITAATGIGRKTIIRRVKADAGLSLIAADALPSRRKWDEADIVRSIEAVGGDVSFRQLRQMGLASRASIAKWRSQNASIDALASEAIKRVHFGRSAIYAPDAYQRAIQHLQSGNPISTLVGQGLPSAVALRKWGRSSPGFAERYRAAISVYRGLGDVADGFAFKRALSQNELYAAVDRVISRGLEPHERDDVRSEMILAVLTGEIGEADITREMARSFVTAYHREAGTWRSHSLDAPTFGDSNRTMHDVLAG